MIVYSQVKDYIIGGNNMEIRREINDFYALLAECYRNCLDLAEQYQIHSIAFPSISTGKFCYPKVKAAEIAVTTVDNWIVEHPYYVLEVVFSCPDQRNYNVMKERLQSF